MKRKLWGIYLAANVVAMGLASGMDPASGVLVSQGIAVGAIVAVVTGARVWSRQRRAWYLMAAGAAFFLAAGLVMAELMKANGGLDPFPSAADGLFYAGYISLIAGGASLIRSRSRRRDWANLVDALIVAAGAGLIVWAFFMAPYARQGDLPIFERFLSTGYSVFDLALIGVWARLAIGPGARNPSYYLFAGCFVSVLIADLLTTLTIAGAYTGELTPLFATMAFVGCGAGALHPKMNQLTERDHVPTVLTRRRMALLGVALSMAPAVLVVAHVTKRPVDASTVVAGSFILASLVLVRMVLLLRANERKAQRERILREASHVLVGATTKEEMHEGALSAVVELAGGGRAVRASLATGPAGAMHVVASVGAGARQSLGQVIPVEAMGPAVMDALAARQTLAVHNSNAFDLRDVESPEDLVSVHDVSVVVLPLVSQNALRGAIFVTSPAPIPAEAVLSLSDFASEVALALEAAALVESLHRRKSERRFKALIEQSSDLLMVVGREGVVSFASPSASRVLGVDSGDLVEAAPLPSVHPDDRAVLDNLLAEAGRRPVGVLEPAELRVQHADGTWRWFETNANNLLRDPEVAGLVLTSRDVTDRKIAELAVTESEARFRSLVQNSSDIVVVVGEDEHFRYISPAVERVLGYTPERLAGSRPIDIVHPEDAAAALAAFAAAINGEPTDQCRTEARVRHADGSWHTLDITATDLRNEASVGGVVLNARDVTDRKELEGELRFQALHDGLTGLANRALFSDRVSHALQRRSDRPDMVAVLFIDLDDFKTINDSLGHAAGDAMLVEVGNRLRQCVRTADTPARLGGDEFAVLLEEIYTQEQVETLAQRVMDALLEPFAIDGRTVPAGASIGIAIDNARASTAETLLRNADVAMYLAKERGKRRYEIFESSMHAVTLERMELRNDMPDALASGQFAVHYQPIVSLETGAVTGVEALLRWNHPTRGPVRPDVFIPVAEQSGFITTLGAWVLDQACRDLKAWRDADADSAPGTVSVNLSVRQLEQAGLAQMVADTIARNGLAARDITLELTESILMDDTESVREMLESLRAVGVKLALDDFGAGYSSLGYLHRLPLDIVKIDRSFVKNLGGDNQESAVIDAVVAISERLGLRLVAEGIEEVEQYEILHRLGCHYGQGFLMAKPMPAGEVAAVVAARRPAVAGSAA